MSRMLRIAARIAIAFARRPAPRRQGARSLDRPAGRDHLDRSALPQPLAQQQPAAAHLRAAHHARRRTGSSCPALAVSWQAARRPHLGIQAAQEREVPRRHAVHRRGRGRHLQARAQRAQQPFVDGDVREAHRRDEDRRSRTRSSSRPRRRTCCCRATSPRSYIIPKAVAEKATTEDFNSGKAAIGTGPYKFAEYVPNQRIVLKANYGYWGGEEPWDKVTFKILSNPAARVAALLSGDVQMIETVPTADIAKLSADKNFALADKVSNRVIYVHLYQWNDKAAPVRHREGRLAARQEPVHGPAREQGAVDRDQPRRDRRPHHGEAAPCRPASCSPTSSSARARS